MAAKRSEAVRKQQQFTRFVEAHERTFGGKRCWVRPYGVKGHFRSPQHHVWCRVNVADDEPALLEQALTMLWVVRQRRINAGRSATVVSETADTVERMLREARRAK